MYLHKFGKRCFSRQYATFKFSFRATIYALFVSKQSNLIPWIKLFNNWSYESRFHCCTGILTVVSTSRTLMWRQTIQMLMNCVTFINMQISANWVMKIIQRFKLLAEQIEFQPSFYSKSRRKQSINLFGEPVFLQGY